MSSFAAQLSLGPAAGLRAPRSHVHPAPASCAAAPCPPLLRRRAGCPTQVNGAALDNTSDRAGQLLSGRRSSQRPRGGVHGTCVRAAQGPAGGGESSVRVSLSVPMKVPFGAKAYVAGSSPGIGAAHTAPYGLDHEIAATFAPGGPCFLVGLHFLGKSETMPPRSLPA